MIHKRQRILVIDDQIGVTGSPWQVSFLRSVGATDKRDRECADFPYAFDFCTGCTPAGTYSKDLVLDQVRAGWDPEGGQIWALVLLDVKFGSHGLFGYEVLERLRATPVLGTALPIVMLTTEHHTKAKAAHANADGFLPKVSEDGSPALTRAALDKALFREGLLPDTRQLPREEERLQGNSISFRSTLRSIRRTVREGRIQQMCLLGESGVGKTQLARYARDITCGPAAPFQHLTADPANPHLQAGTLFGCWPGAYNDAPRDGAPGSFELAHNGVLFLDEIANLSPDSQKRLLEVRATESSASRAISRYGVPPLANPDVLARCLPHIRGRFDRSTGLIFVDVALITATNARLDDPAERKARDFRDDLWAGLMPHIVVPPLNDRRSDISLLFQQMLRSRLKLGEVNVHEDAITALEGVDWSVHGNIRGLAWAADVAASRYDDFEIVTSSQLPADLLKSQAMAAVSTLPLAPTARGDTARATTEDALSFPALLIRRYRHDLERLCDALSQTRDPAKPEGENLIPARALRQLLGVPVTGADIDRLILKLFFAPVFRPPKTLENCLRKHGLEQLQLWAKEHPLLAGYAEKALPQRDTTSHHDDKES